MKKLLIIDDDEVLLQALQRTTQDAGYTVFATADGPEGINLFSLHNPDIVLLDLGLPTLSGLQVLKELKKINDKPRIIIFTGYTSPESATEAIENGAFAFLQKGFDYNNLLQTIESAAKS